MGWTAQGRGLTGECRKKIIENVDVRPEARSSHFVKGACERKDNLLGAESLRYILIVLDNRGWSGG